jgi:uncharacterized MAPEG superfamily protein
MTALHVVAYTIILGLVHVIVDSHLISNQYSYRWTASLRESEVPPLTGLAGRVDRAFTNYLETFPFFAAAVLASQLLHGSTYLAQLGSWLYLSGRVAYVLLYAAGYGLARSLIWNVSLAGIVLILVTILR